MDIGIEFKDRLEDLPPDFYFNNREHFFYGCQKIIKDLEWVNTKGVAQSLKIYCYSLFYFTVCNLERITELKLKYPTEVYSIGLRVTKDLSSLFEAIGHYKTIENDYKDMFNMTFDEIRDSKYKKYFEPKRFTVENKMDFEKVKKEGQLKEQIKTTFAWGMYHIDTDKLTDKLCDLVGISGVYRIYNFDGQIIYIGKSYNLGSRIATSLKERKGCGFDYTVIDNKADTDIYEIYYISKLQPVLNGTSNTGEKPTVILPEREFGEVINVYTEKKPEISIVEERRATVVYENMLEFEEVVKELSQKFDIRSMSKPKKNEYDRHGKEHIVTIQITEKQ